jgi:protoheme IX farnesyltransferase
MSRENSLAANPAMASAQEPGVATALLRLSKPGIVLAEVLTGLAGMLLAAPLPPAPTVICPVLAAIALAAAGAAMLNNVLDAAVDRQMLRLAPRSRALQLAGSGRVLIIALLLMVGGMALAAMTAPPLALLLLAAGCFSYIWLYTAWLKRHSPWGVLAGGIPGALPPLIGSAAVSGTVSEQPLLLALLVFVWQLPHFWLLALECRDQYAQAGIPVLPVTHGDYLTRVLTLTTTALLLPITCAIWLRGSLSSGYLTVSCGAGIIFLLFCARCLFQTHDYRQGFRASLTYLVVIFGVICVESFLR